MCSKGSGNLAKEINYFQPKYNIQSNPPKNIPKLNIYSIPNEDTIQSIDSNLNKGFDLSMKSLQTGNDEGNIYCKISTKRIDFYKRKNPTKWWITEEFRRGM